MIIVDDIADKPCTKAEREKMKEWYIKVWAPLGKEHEAVRILHSKGLYKKISSDPT